MVKSHPGVDSLLTNIRRVIPPRRTMEITEETFKVLKEHASKHYSSPRYDEVLVNLVKFYESNDGPKHYD